jgi:hypothetical protein
VNKFNSFAFKFVLILKSKVSGWNIHDKLFKLLCFLKLRKKLSKQICNKLLIKTFCNPSLNFGLIRWRFPSMSAIFQVDSWSNLEGLTFYSLKELFYWVNFWFREFIRFYRLNFYDETLADLKIEN